MAQADGASPASSTSSAQPAPPTHMHRRSSLPCFPFPASAVPCSPASGNSASSSSLRSLASLPSVPAARLHSAPSASRSVSPFKPRAEHVDVKQTPLDAKTEADAAGSNNRFDNLHLRLAAHPAIQRLRQLEEAHSDEQQQLYVEEDEYEEEDEDDEITKVKLEEQSEQQPYQLVKEEASVTLPDTALRATYDVHSYPMAGLPAVDEAEHAPLAGLVTAFPFVQQFIPQPSRAEKKKQFIERIHATHQLTIPNNYSPTVVKFERPALPPRPSFSHADLSVDDECSLPQLPPAQPIPFRADSSSPTVSSDDSHEELSADFDTCSQADCSSPALADTFASLSPNFIYARHPSGFSFPVPAPTAPFLSPVLSSLAGPLPLLQPSVRHPLPAVFSPPTLLNSSDSSLCPDDLQLGEPAWDNGGHWMADW